MRMTRKGQVTIPKEVRQSLGLNPGSNVGFEQQDGHFYLVNRDATKGESRGEQLVRHIQESVRRFRAQGEILDDMTVDEIMEMTRGPFDDVAPR